MKHVALLLTLAMAIPNAHAEHIVSPQEVHSRLRSAASDRAQNVESLTSLGKTYGVDVKAGVARLSDAELADLAARANSLTTDPVAGGRTALIILASVGAVLIILLLIGRLLIGPTACAEGYC